MDFGLSDDQQLLQASARDFLSAECPPGLVRATAAAEDGRSAALESKIAALGWNGVLVPRSLGGLGLGVLDAALLLVEIGRALAPGPFLFSSILVSSLLARADGRALRQRRLAPLLSGAAAATVACVEDGEAFPPRVVRARARRVRSGWRLSGRKLFAPYAASADWILTPFRTAGSGAPAVTLFLVDRHAPGVSVEPLDTVDRTRRLDEVAFEDVEVGPEAVVGGVGGGGAALARLLDLAALALAADSLGGAERTLEMAVDYSKTRVQFGRPIGSFQAVQHLAAEMVAELEPTRALVWYAAHALDALPRTAPRAASMAKARACEVYARTSNRAVQIHGGIGFTWEHDLHFWFKRAKWNEAAFGDAQYHRERIAALGAY